MSEKENSATETSAEDTIGKVHKLQQRFYKVCGELYKNVEFIGEPMYNLMLEHYFAQYKREYELMNAAEFIDVDKHIEELKTQRDREIEAVKLERDKQKKLLDITREREIRAVELEKSKLTEELITIREKELEEVRLEHEAQSAEIERRREKLNNDIEVRWQTAMLESQIKLSRVTPQTWRRFRIFNIEFGKTCKNEAWEYAEKSANNEITEYLTRRAQEVSELSGEETAEPVQMSEREYRKWEKRFEKEQRRLRKEAEKERKKNEQDQTEIPQESAAEAAETPVQGDELGTAASVSLIAERNDSD